ncbi:protocadherin Fat 4-like [Montipora foliosa]|uniref:protocadherin Fat 4-like n=1 Tax=Montipora foliosa TaxID=591990 RepID=UPI0035F20EF0
MIDGITSKVKELRYGVPQGSVLGPILYLLYTSPIGDIIRRHELNYHLFADDTQLYLSLKPTPAGQAGSIAKIGACVSEIDSWMAVDADEGLNAAISYNIFSGNTGSAFSVDPNSGVLSTARELDRETIAQYSLKITATDGRGKGTTGSLMVHIADINDNAPIFTKPMGYDFEVNEGQAGLTVGVVKAVDKDEGTNAGIIYILKPVLDYIKFTIVASSGEIRTAVALDRETTDRHNIRVISRDAGSPSYESEVQVLINVSDINDHRPAFSQRHYFVEVKEQQPAHVILNLTATDGDIGINAGFFYSILSGNSGNIFLIDSVSGALSTTAPLDREEEDSYILLVRVSDSHGNHSYGIVFDDSTVVEVIVEDANDNSPVFAKSVYPVQIYENITTGSAILQLSAQDPDVDDNMAIRYSIIKGNTLERFFIDDYSGVLYVRSPIDRDPPRNENAFLLTVMANDEGQTSLNSTTKVSITVFDVNDSPPQFQSEEITDDEEFVLMYQAYMPQNPSFPHSTYGNFSIVNKDSAECKADFRLEKGDIHIFVEALRVPPISKCANGTIGDGSEAMYTVNIPEDALVGTTILIPVCTDRDASTNNDLRFAITKGNDLVPPQFFVDSSTGIITSYQSFDFDKSPNKYSLILSATDAGQPPLSGNTTVMVQLKNVNDNNPIFTQQKYFFTANEGWFTSGPKEVGKVAASDRDQDEESSIYGQIRYEFVNQSGFYRDHQWPLDSEDSGKVRDIRSGLEGTLKNGAQIVFDPYLGDVVSLNTSEAWILMGDFQDNCVSNPNLCPEGLTVAFWLKYISGQYIISSGGKSSFATGFDFYREKADGRFNVILETSTHRWRLKLNDIPKVWFYASFAWHPSTGLRYFQDGLLVLSTQTAENITRASDIFTTMTVGKPNNVDIGILDYYSKILISDLLIWRTLLTDEEMFHSYTISRHVTGREMPSSPQYAGKFAISEDGAITVIGELDRETKQNYTFVVRASDLDPFHPRHNTTVVEIEITDSNDNSPVFRNTTYEADLIEHSSIGALALTVEAKDTDLDSNSLISYTIVSGNLQNAFTINSSTGEIKVNKDIDREQIQQFVLGVQAKDGGSPALQKTVQVTINIVDVNDNPPIISPSTYVAGVKENLPPGQSVLRLTVEDADYGINGQVTFHVNSDKFAVNYSTGTLYTTQTIDREQDNEYLLTVLVTDGGVGATAKSSSVSLQILVEDENDNSPKFTKDVYKVAISENATIGSSVIRVLASDPDDGSNADLTFTLRGGDGVFVINVTSGLITVLKKVDRESSPGGYSLMVTAQDHGYPLAKFTRALVNITVSDINDNTPRFDKFTYSAEVREDSDVKEFVAAVHAVDEDEGLAGEIFYFITAGNVGGAFAIDAFGNITVATKLDRETKAAYELTITAKDGAGEPRSASAEVDITVSDANDNPPFFRAVPLSIFISESALPGTPVYTLIANDPDVGTNKAITFAGNSPERKFAIDGQTGVITTVGALDFEKQQNYTFYVVAMDQGVPQLNSSTLYVNVTIVDENDNNPKFERTMYGVQIWENETIGGHVIWLKATEKDSALGSIIGYNISAGDPQGQFRIFYRTGQIVVQKPLDRELVPNYTLRVTATDNGNPPRYGETSVAILLKDVNDRTPEFQFYDYQSEVSEDSVVGTTVTTLLATDMDSAENTVLLYSILSGDADEDINITTVKRDGKYVGIVTVAKTLDRETKDVYELYILVSDGLHNSTVLLEIQVTDVNDRSPEFNSTTEYSANVAENSPSGLFVLRVSATDSDLGSNAVISYGLEGGDNKFTIDANTGDIRTSSSPLDREEKGRYQLLAVATDRGNRQGRKDVIVQVTDLNDEVPRFNPPVVNVSLTEGNLTTDIHVTTVNATDKDEGDNKRITYSIINGNLGDVFQIDENAGVITTRKDLDREAPWLAVDADAKGVYLLTVQASDHGSPVQRSTATRFTIIKSLGFLRAGRGCRAGRSYQLKTIKQKIDQEASTWFSTCLLNARSVNNKTLQIKDYTIDKDVDLFAITESWLKADESSDFVSRDIALNGYGFLHCPRPNGTGGGLAVLYKSTIKIELLETPQPYKSFELMELLLHSFTPKTNMMIIYRPPPSSKNQLTPSLFFDEFSQLLERSVSSPGQLLLCGDFNFHEEDPSDHNTRKFLDVYNDHSSTNKDNQKLDLVIGRSDENLIADFHVHDPIISDHFAIHCKLNSDRPPNRKKTVSYRKLRSVNTDAFRQDILSSELVSTNSSDLNSLCSSYDDVISAIVDKHAPLVTKTITVRPNSPWYTDDIGVGKSTQRRFRKPLALYSPPRTSPGICCSMQIDEPLQSAYKTFHSCETALVRVHNDMLCAIDKRYFGALLLLDLSAAFDTVDHNILLQRLHSRFSTSLPSIQFGNDTEAVRNVGAIFDSTLSVVPQVLVLICDINDNTPQFPPDGYSVKISEGAKANSDVIAAVAEDPDAGSNRQLLYELISGNTGDDFTLDPNTAMIRTRKNLERQQTFKYTLTIGVSDQGKPSKVSMTQVHIEVGDINDNDPVFDPVNYTVSVYENSPVGTPLLNVTAADADTGQNARITYSVTGGDPYSVFTVITQENYGTVQIKSNVDREQRTNYSLTITAADAGVPLSRKAYATVFVTVLDQNDNRPQFSQALYTGSIMENSGPSTTVDMKQEIEAIDTDVGLFGSIEFHLNGSQGYEFDIDPIRGVITTRKYPPPTLDREKRENYSFHVVAVDENGLGHASFIPVKIQVIDANDNVPRFEPLTKSVSISEDSPVGFSVTKVFASDPDSNLNGKVSYSMLSGTNGKLTIGRNDGVIRVAGALDREIQEHYTLNISALDGSYFPLEGYGTVFVTLTDINDNVPIFESLVYKVKIAENSPVGTHLVNVTAKDPDHGVNADISYSMSHSKFKIDSKTGSITTTGKLDRERQDTYSFIVRVQDGGGLASSVAVNIVITDINDNYPHFLSANYKTDVIEKTPVGAIILTMVAQDQDIHENADITYSMEDAKDDLFSIDPEKGFIKVQKTINRIDLLQRGIIHANGSYTFRVTAKDRGIVRLSSDITVEINIVDAGDDSPVFNRSSYEVNVTENKLPGTPVLRVKVSQHRPGASLTFTIVPSQTKFYINTSTGVISTLTMLDREAQGYYVFTVQATDNGQIPLSGYTSVRYSVRRETI